MAVRAVISVLFAALLLPALALAVQAEEGRRVFVPAPPKGKGESCVADTDFMRRYHMTVLNHQRDDTVHEGIRTKQFSLKECIECHAVNGPDARPVTVQSPQHFCRSCHDYAAVKIDCFECHASRPELAKAARTPAGEDDNSLRAALARYLGGKPK